jgi:hypothetical protein
MEKLIELLNEYINKTILPYDRGAECIKFENGFFYFRDWDCLIEDTIISNRYWFIKWLVDNDKIKIPHELDELPAMYWYDYDSVECKADRLLMLLSISSSPIDDLISYLK